MDAFTDLRCLPAFADGRVEAEKDIADGKLGYRGFGKLVAWWEEAAAVLRERYGLTCQVVGHCLTSSEVAAKAIGYNERMQQELNSRFGADVLAAVFRDVERKRKKHRNR